MNLVDKKLFDLIFKDFSNLEKSFVMLAYLLTRPRVNVSDLIPLQELPEPKGNIFYADFKTQKRKKSRGNF